MTPTNHGLSILRKSGCAPESDAAAKSLVEEIQAVAFEAAAKIAEAHRPGHGDTADARTQEKTAVDIMIAIRHAGEE